MITWAMHSTNPVRQNAVCTHPLTVSGHISRPGHRIYFHTSMINNLKMLIHSLATYFRNHFCLDNLNVSRKKKEKALFL